VYEYPSDHDPVGCTDRFAGLDWRHVRWSSGAIMALVLAGGMNFFSYWFSDKIVIKMYGGQEVTPRTTPNSMDWCKI